MLFVESEFTQAMIYFYREKKKLTDVKKIVK